jgi:predicted transcriptional regulator
VLPDDLVDQVTRRVLDRIGDGVVRDVVLDVAERLVREEIERIKAKA